MLRTLFSFRGLILVFGGVAVALPIALVGQLGIVRTLNQINGDVAAIRQGQIATASLLQYQLDEETGVRGYAATGLRAFLEPYEHARAAMPPTFATLEPLVAEDGAGVHAGEQALGELRRLNGEWLRTVAEPIVAGNRQNDALLLRGKALIDRFRTAVAPIARRFDERYRLEIDQRNRTIQNTTLVALFAIAIITIEIVVFAIVIARMRYELDRERGFVETLQNVASVRLVPPPHLALGTAYRSATRGARVGGDLYDVYRLDADRTLLVVGDVSGKGLAAAVDTTFVRFALRALASEGLAPDAVVQRFDVLYRSANGAPEAFVTLFVAVHDRRDGSLDYANAGHEAAWVRRGDDVAMLPPTGPIVGLGAFAGFVVAPARTRLGPGDLLVLATDGLTEARDPHGATIAIERVTAWVRNAPATPPQALVDALLAAVARYSRGRISDDLAILAVEPLA